MKRDYKGRDGIKTGYPVRICVTLLLLIGLFLCPGAISAQAAGETVLSDNEGGTLSDTSTVYVIEGDDTRDVTVNYFNVPKNTGTHDQPVRIVLDGVNITQRDKSPAHSYIHIEENSNVVIELRNSSFIEAWSHQETLSSNDGMSGIHVSNNSTVTITSADGDGETTGSLEVRGGGGKYGGAGIGARYNKDMGTVIIAGGTIEAYGGTGAAGIGSGRNDTDGYEGDIQITGGKVSAYGGDEGAGIGSGRDGKAYSIEISGGDIYAEGGEYAAGIGAGNAVDAGSGGNLVDLTITGGSIRTLGGMEAAGIGCSDEGELEGRISISSDSSDIDIVSHGRGGGAGIGGGNASNLDKSDLIEIKGKGTLVAYGGKHGAGIGGGSDGGSPEIVIAGNSNGVRGERGDAPEGSRKLNITAMAGSMTDKDRLYEGYKNTAAAIGSGKASGGDISIKNAVLETRADGQAADIGGGLYHVNPSGTVNSITIENCEITSYSRFKSAPGIGAGYGGSVRNITISDTKYSGGSIGGSPMDVPYTDLNDVDSITISNSDISAVWNEEELGPFTGGFTPSTKPQEHGAAGIGSGQYGSMDTITITDSNIVARGFGSGSGIGAGGAGGNGFTLLDLTKWNVGDTGTIEISGSDVDAHSGTADFDEHSPIAYYDGQLFMRIENPKMFGGGAGIGGGSASNTGKVWIHDCGTVTAVGHGAGIGTGDGGGNISKGGVDYIWLENIEKIYAKAGNNSAGIGTGGSGSGINKLDANSGALKQIYIKNCADIEAYGGKWGAGIGLGGGSPCYYHIEATEKGDWPMAIIDSNVKAYGGYTGAGIGGGLEDSVLNTGGENPRLLIQGKCRVEAVGGKSLTYEDGVGIHGGGAGIGGGCCGAASVIRIDIDEDTECAAKGTYDDPAPSKYYVKATGGDGGAGIGSGGKSFEENLVNRDNADSESIDIYRGAVFAKGGGSIKIERSKLYHYYMGAGAGIGGGSYGSKIKSLYIKGGYITAEAGQNTCDEDKADDIGAGGNPSEDPGPLYDNSNRKNGSLEIMDGTVLCGTIGTFTDERKIAGGSVSAVLKDATGVVDINGEKVYKTTAKLPKNIKNEKVDGFSTSRGYGKSHIYADENGKIYLYLYPKGSETDHQQWADVEVNTAEAGRNNWHYTGYTNTEHTGILKIDGKKIPFSGPDAVRWNEDFTLDLQDGADDEDHVPAGTGWTDIKVSGSASLKETLSSTSPGMSLKLHADSLGDFEVTAQSPYTPDPELYWASTAYYKGTVQKAVPEIRFTENPAKVYDATPVTEPSVETESSGAVTYAWFRANGTALSGPPSDAGDYYVTATVAETGVYAEASARQDFSITPAPTAVSQTAEIIDDPECVIKARVFGLYPQASEAYGNVHFTIYDADGQIVDGWNDKMVKVYKADNIDYYSAEAVLPEAPAGSYRVTVQYKPDAAPNFAASEAVERTYNKDLAQPDFTIPDLKIGMIYGDDQGANLMPSDTGDYEEWTFTVIHDSFSGLKLDGEDVPATVSVNSRGKVSVQHAGRAVIEIRAHDNDGVYEDVSGCAVVSIARKELTVTSYAYRGADEPENRVGQAVYGSLGTLSYGLEFNGLEYGDTPETFTHGHGTLGASAVAETAGASETVYPVTIKRNGKPLSIGGVSYDDVFLSRDYDITYKEGSLKVTKRGINVQSDDSRGVYGGDEPEYSWSIAENQPDEGGLASWDSEQTVFGEAPQIARTGRAAGEYKSLNAGSYEDCLEAGSGWTSDNYAPAFIPGDLTVGPADLSDTSRFSSEAESAEYNGRPQKQGVTVLDTAFETPAKLREGTDYTAQYPDNERMTDAGVVTVMISGKDGSNYTGTAEATYRIEPKTVTASSDSAEKVYDGAPLTAGGSLTGLVSGETAELVISGSQTEPGESVNKCDVLWNGTAKAANYKVSYRQGMLKVTAPETVYRCVSGAGSKWKHGSKKGLQFTFKRNWHDDETYGRFRGITFDGKEVPSGSYSAKAGSVIITLSPSFLEKQKKGRHTLAAVFDDGRSEDVKLSVTGDDSKASDGSGKGKGGGAATGDNGGIIIWILIMLASAAGICLTAVIRKKERIGSGGDN